MRTERGARGLPRSAGAGGLGKIGASVEVLEVASPR